MRAIIQRVKRASVKNGDKFATINSGLLLLVGFEEADTHDDIDWMAKKIVKLRIFDDENDVMNIAAIDCLAEILVISQFTLFASTAKGNRPSYVKAAVPTVAVPLYEKFIELLKNNINTKIETGWFGTNMQVELINDGPVTFFIDSKNKYL